MSTSPASPTVSDLRSRIDDLLPRDERRLRRRLEGTRRLRDEAARAAAQGLAHSEAARLHERVADLGVTPAARDAALTEGSIDHIMTRLSRLKNPHDLPGAFGETAP